MNIYITGSTGFVGQNLIPYLNKVGFQTNQLSLRLLNWAEKIDKSSNVIIHLAGKAHDIANTLDEQEYFEINRDLTIKVFQEFLKSNASDFIYFSSVKASADNAPVVLTEDIVPSPKTPYGKSKLAAEQYLLAQKIPSNKRLFIIRPGMIHGPGNKGNLNLLYKYVKKGLPYPLAAFQNKRSFLSIDNLCFVVTEIIRNRNVHSGIYNLVDDETLSTNEIVGVISNTIQKKARLWHISKAALVGIAKLGDLIKMPFNTNRLQKLTESYIVSNQKIKMALGIQQLPITASEGLKKTIESFRSK